MPLPAVSSRELRIVMVLSLVCLSVCPVQATVLKIEPLGHY